MSKPETKTDAPKTDIPKSEPRADAPRAEAPRFDPTAAFRLPYEQWTTTARENLMRLQQSINAYWDELASYENAAYERAKAATADLASLASESISYVAAMTAEWRKMTIEATRRFTDSIRA